MGIGPPGPKRTHTGSTRDRRRHLPVLECRIDIKRAVLQIQLWIRLAEMQACRYDLVLQRKRHLHEPYHAGSGIQMADVCLDRPDPAKLLGLRAHAESLSQGRHFDRIPQWRGRSVSLDIGNRFRINLGQGMCHRDHFGLTLDPGCSETHAL